MRLPPVRAAHISLAIAAVAVFGMMSPMAFAQDKQPLPAGQPGQTAPVPAKPTPTPAAPATPTPIAPAPAPETPDGTSAQPDSGSADAGKPRTPAEIYSELDLFGQVFDNIRAEYVDVPDERKLIEAALQGMLTSLDPHSGYLDAKAFSDMQQENAGEFGGLGIEVQMQDGAIKVVHTIEDTPAAKAGVLANDQIIALDGVNVKGMGLDDAVKKMRGPVGTKIKLTIQRQGAKDPIELTLTRDIIAEQIVHSSLEGKDQDVAYIRLDKFSEQAASGIQKAITDLWAKNNGKPPKGIILDLRNNPGGLVDQAVAVADAFLKQGVVVLTRSRIASESSRYEAKPDALDAKLAGIPMVVLINGGSASAAEILAGALQDHKRATLVGTRSFGKGTVQTIIGLGAGNGAMRLTTARYYTPNNRSIQAAGIQPDIVIKETIPAELKGKDEIVGEAALPGQIGGGTQPVATTGSSVYVPADKTKDDQLQYAIKLIDGVVTDPAYPAKGGDK